MVHIFDPSHLAPSNLVQHTLPRLVTSISHPACRVVVALQAYTPGEQINDAIKLNTNECAWGPAPGVLKAVGEISVDQLRLYPSPMADRVRAAAADVFEVSAGQVLVGNGSDDCLTVVMRSFLSPGDKCACPWPTYSLYDTLATIQGVDIVHAAWQEAPDPLLKAKGEG